MDQLVTVFFTPEHEGDGRAVARIHARDLRELTRKAARSRVERPHGRTAVGIHAVLAEEATAALERWHLAAAVPDGSLVYVGTPEGLAGLIRDLGVIGVVDEAVISTSSRRELDLIRGAVPSPWVTA